MNQEDENAYGLAERLALARKARGISQQQVADRIGVTRRTISDYELGRRQPSLDALGEIAKCYQVTTDFLLGIDKSNNSFVDLEGLTSKEESLIRDLVDDMKMKNAKLANFEK